MKITAEYKLSNEQRMSSQEYKDALQQSLHKTILYKLEEQHAFTNEYTADGTIHSSTLFVLSNSDIIILEELIDKVSKHCPNEAWDIRSILIG